RPSSDLAFFLGEIDDYVKRNHALKLIHSPYHIYRIRNGEGEVIDSEKNNPGIVDIYTKLGYTHQGFTKQLVTEELLRHQAILDITESEAELLRNMDSKTRYNTRAVEQMDLKLRYLDEDEYDKFIEIYKDTEERIGFAAVSGQKIKNLLKTLTDRTYLTLSYIEVDKYLERLNKELDSLETDKSDMEKKLESGQGTKRMKGRLNETKDLV